MFKMKKIAVSACLGFERCRYDGKMVKMRRAIRPGEKVEYLPICPEVAIGLGVPRRKIRLVKAKRGIRLIQPSSGAELTGKMRKFAASFLKRNRDVDGFILKSKSPSCGVGDVKVYSSASSCKPLNMKGTGIFASEILKRYPKKTLTNENVFFTKN